MQVQLLTTIILDANVAPDFPAMYMSLNLILIVVLLFLMGILAGAEVAFFTLNNKDVNYLKTKDSTSSRQIIQLLDNPELLSSTLKASKYSLAITVIILAHYLLKILLPDREGVIISFIIILISVSFLLLFIGEVLPKVYARQNNMRMAIFASPIVNVMYNIFKFPAKALLSDTYAYKRKKQEYSIQHSTDSKEFEATVALSMGHTASKEEIDIFKGIVKFGSITVKQIMQPRLDVGAIQESWSFSKLKTHIISGGYSRMPVYRNNIDEIVGMIHTKDLLPYNDLNVFDWHSIIRPTYYVHEYKLIEELLNEFQEKKIHFAVVVDEFGGTSGIVTLEDILEEIIGDIKDEFDEDDTNKYKKINEESYIFEGKMLINDMCKIMGIEYNTFNTIRSESDSVAGLVLEIAQKFPSINERISYGIYDFTILSIEKLRITSVKVEKNNI